VRLLPGVLEACVELKGAGFTLVVITNQGTVARGGATVETVERVNRRLRDLLTVDGRELIDAVYFCPFHPIGIVPEYTREHPWRKPAPGMILAAAADMGLDLGRSWMVGDAERDIEAGIRAEIDPARCLRVGPHQRLSGLGAAVRVILATGIK
jgi:D-glycero-D-manno-heptose 1,7-bisphosphate phosphatase